MTKMPDGIVVGYDGSPDSDKALRWAADEAHARGTALLVCLAWAPDYLEVLDEASAYDAAQHRGEQILARGVQRAESVLGPGRARPLLVRGSAPRVLCEHSRTAGMVVVGSRGHSELTGLLLGSVSWQLASYGQGRVVVVRGQGRPANDGAGQIVVGVDGSEVASAAMTFAFEEAELHRVPLLAVCALADAPGSLGAGHRMEDDFAQLMTVREKEYPDVTVLRQVSVGSPRTALLTAAAGAQLVVVGARGRGGLSGMSLGSVAQAVLHYAPCPVAVIRPPTPGNARNIPLS